MAENCCVLPATMLGFGGLTEIDCSVAASIVKLAELEKASRLAAILAVPTVRAFAKPFWLMLATVGVEELHAADAVTSLTLPSKYLPTTRSCWTSPVASEMRAGAIASDVNGLI